jgi:hypothetical protein
MTTDGEPRPRRLSARPRFHRRYVVRLADRMEAEHPEVVQLLVRQVPPGVARALIGELLRRDQARGRTPHHPPNEA